MLPLKMQENSQFYQQRSAIASKAGKLGRDQGGFSPAPMQNTRCVKHKYMHSSSSG